MLVHTDLVLSGPAAQYGRQLEMVQDTAAQIMSRFATNLREHVARSPGS